MAFSFGGRARLACICLVAAATLAACTAMNRFHGYIPPEAELAQLTPGVDTRDSVVASVGAPGSDGMIGDGNFYYVQSTFRHYGAFAPQETDRQVLVLSFTPAGVLSNIERFGLEGGRVVVISRRVTDDGIGDVSFLRQLMGNVGNFDASSLIGSE